MISVFLNQNQSNLSINNLYIRTTKKHVRYIHQLASSAALITLLNIFVAQHASKIKQMVNMNTLNTALVIVVIFGYD